MNKLSSTILISGLTSFLGSTILVPQILAQNSNFGDVRGYWAEEYVTTLADRNIIGGFPDGSFRPNADITRAQFAAIAVKAFNLSPSNNTRNFTDVRSNYWAAPAISAVSNSGLVTGFPDGTFRPEDRITRAQALVILAKALGNRATPNSNQLDRYSDRQAIPDWATESVSRAANARIIVNFPDSTRISPNNLATIGEVAALMYQTLFRLGNSNLTSLAIGTLDSSTNPNTPRVSPIASDLVIDRIETNANQRQTLNQGDELLVTAYGTPRSRANFRLEGLNQNRAVNMTEVESGVYEGRYTIRRNDEQINSRLVVRLAKQGANPVTRELNRAIAIDSSNNSINDDNNNSQSLRPEITNFNNNDAINLPVNLMGQTLPNADVRITVEALRSVIGIVDVSQTISNTTVRANGQGRFRVQLPSSNNLISGTRYRIRLIATQNNQSESNELLLRQN